MEALGQYILSVTAIALLCGVVSGIVRSGGAKEVIRLLCGLILAFAVIRPLAHVNLKDLEEGSFPFAQEAEAMAAGGEEMARQALAEGIKAECEAYILDKAAAMDAAPQVEITLSQDEPPIPVAAAIRGSVSPQVQSQLATILETDLGIAKENQLWTGEP